MTTAILPTIFQRTTRFGLYLFAWTIAISQVSAQLGAVLMILGWLGEGLVNRNWQVQWHHFFWPYLFYLGWNLLATLLSPRVGHSLWAIADNEWEVVVMLMLFWTVTDALTARRLLLGFLVTGSIAMVYALWQVWYGVELYRNAALTPAATHLFRAVGFYGLSLTFAAFALIGLSFALAFVLFHREERRSWSFTVILFALGVFGTFARGIWLAMVALVPVFITLVGDKERKRRLAIAAPVVLALLLLIPQIRSRAVSAFDPSGNETRMNLWKTAVHMGAAHPLFGVGQDNWDYYFEEFKVPGFYDTTAHAHNDYLNVLICSGVPGLLAFIVMWGIALRTGVRSLRRTPDPLAQTLLLGGTLALTGLLVGALTQDYYGTFLNTWHWWFAVGFLFLGHRLAEEGQRSS